MNEKDENCYSKNNFEVFTKNLSEILNLDSNEFSQDEILQRFPLNFHGIFYKFFINFEKNTRKREKIH